MDIGPMNNRRGFKPVARRHNTRSMDFEALIREGENAQGFTAQTVNGTAHAEGTGWNRREPMTAPQVEAGGAWKKGRHSIRSGE